jgi:hypothetical protein
MIEQLLINTQISQINTRQETQIPEVEGAWSETWFTEARSWKKALQKKIMSELQQKTQKEIIEKVEMRFGMIDKEERRMINSILEKPWKRIVVDKVIIQDPIDKSAKILLTEPNEVKTAADEYYKDQFKARQHSFDTISEKWEQEYKPKENINKEWFKNILDPIEEGEWIENIQLAKKDTAPGASGISYTMLQNSGPKAREKYLELANLVLETGIFPRK